MKTFYLLCLILACFIFSCAKSSNVKQVNSDSSDTVLPVVETADIGGEAEILTPFKSVVDTLNSAGDPHVDVSYFLFDITEDGSPELWIKSGTCEADYRLRAYTLDSGKPRKIYDEYGGHSEFFIFKGQLVCVMCNTGGGLVITYVYDGKRVIDSMVEFSTWNESGEALSEPHDSIADEKLKYWEENYDNFIELLPL